MVYRLILSYVGTEYSGWQRQPNAMSVQQKVEEALASLVGQQVVVVGAGRTDAGVHARGQVAHLEPDGEWEVEALIKGTNHFLPSDVRVMAADRVRQGFHARKSARAKEYRYRLSTADIVSALDAPFVVPVAHPLDLEPMRAATALLVGEHDFTAFALAGGSHGQPRRTIVSADWLCDGDRLELRIVGDGFLRGMVRSLVGTLLEVGRGRRSVKELESLLTGRPRGEAGPTAPAHGLCLERVEYDAEWLLD
jgi:tRNA pseudouridine38-40 synthase